MKTGFDRFMEIFSLYEQLEAEDRRDEAEKVYKKIAQIFLRVHANVTAMSEDDFKASYNFDKYQRYGSDRMISYITSNENYITEYKGEYENQFKILEATFGKKLIREYVMSRAQNHKKHYKEYINDLARKLDKDTLRLHAKYMTMEKSIQMETIIIDMMNAANIAIHSKAELECIKDDWRGFFKKYMGDELKTEMYYPISIDRIRHRIKFMSDVLNYMDAKIDYDNDLFNVEKAE